MSAMDVAIKRGIPVYEIDFGEEGTERYVRLSDFNAALTKELELRALVAAILTERSKCFIPTGDHKEATFKWDEKARAAIAEATGGAP